MTKHELPKLPFSYDALEPYIDAKTMEIHHTKHHQAYVDKLNVALEKFPEFSDQTIENLISHLKDIPEEIRAAVQNNGGGHANHSFFWQILKPQGEELPQGKVLESLIKTFNDFETFKTKFNETALAHFGSGWVWLAVTPLGGLEIYSTPNQISPLMEEKTPILGLDVWEHAYYLKYQNRRTEYIDAWWHIVNWEKVSEHYEKTLLRV